MHFLRTTTFCRSMDYHRNSTHDRRIIIRRCRIIFTSNVLIGLCNINSVLLNMDFFGSFDQRLSKLTNRSRSNSWTNHRNASRGRSSKLSTCRFDGPFILMRLVRFICRTLRTFHVFRRNDSIMRRGSKLKRVKCFSGIFLWYFFVRVRCFVYIPWAGYFA